MPNNEGSRSLTPQPVRLVPEDQVDAWVQRLCEQDDDPRPPSPALRFEQTLDPEGPTVKGLTVVD